jgi:cutinase
VMAYTTEDSMPAGYTLPPGITGPMAPEVANHVAAVALFGKPSSGFLQMIYTGAPPISVGHLYTGKTTDICIPDDPVCSPTGGDQAAHTLYGVNGLTDQAADYAATHLATSGAGSQ